MGRRPVVISLVVLGAVLLAQGAAWAQDGQAPVGGKYAFWPAPTDPWADVTITPTRIDFGSVRVGGSAVRSVVVRNAGDTTSSPLSVAFYANHRRDFALEGATMSKVMTLPLHGRTPIQIVSMLPTLPPGASARLQVAFKPRSAPVGPPKFVTDPYSDEIAVGWWVVGGGTEWFYLYNVGGSGRVRCRFEAGSLAAETTADVLAGKRYVVSAPFAGTNPGISSTRLRVFMGSRLAGQRNTSARITGIGKVSVDRRRYDARLVLGDPIGDISLDEPRWRRMVDLVGLARPAAALPRAVMGTPTLRPGTPVRGRRFLVSGSISRHSARSSVRVYVYRRVSGRWRSYGDFPVAVAARAVTYRARCRLPGAGRYYVRAYHRDAGHRPSWSRIKYFRVR